MAALRRRWRWIALATLLAFVGSVLFVTLVPPRYTGEARLLLQAGDNFFTRPGADRQDAQQPYDDQAVASQVQVVMSRDIAREAIRRLGLVGNPEFDPLVGGLGVFQRLGVLLGVTKSPFDRPPEDRVLDAYFDHLLVYPVGKSRIVSIEFRAKDPDLAAKAANTVAELYLGQQEDAKKDVARSASTWLGSSIDDLRKRVETAEAKTEEFRSRMGLLSGGNNITFASQQLTDLNTQLGQARSTQSDAGAKAKLIRDMIRDGRVAEVPDVANNELIRRLSEQRINLRAQLALESRTLLPGHPRIKELNAQVSDLESQIRTASDRISRTLENDARIAGARVESIEAAIEGQKKIVAQANANEVQLRAMEREARTQREQLESYLGRYREATARDTGNAMPPDARIVSRAVVPQTPSFPKKAPTVAIVTLAALVLSAGAVMAGELLGSAPVVTRAAGRPGLPGPGLAPAPVAAREIEPAQEIEPVGVLPAEPDPRYDFAALVHRLEQARVAGRGRRVLVTSVPRSSDGEALSYGLALTLAGAGRAIVIEVDEDEASEPEEGLGFTDLVAGDASFAEVIRRQPGSTLDRVAVGTLENAALRSDPDALATAISAFDQTYDWVVCLLRTVEGGAFLPLLAGRMDVAVIASNLEPANPDLVHAYEVAKEAGAADVVIAREHTRADHARAA